jgi:hypothetical protein
MAVHQAPTLDLLKPHYDICYLTTPLTLKDIESHTRYAVNLLYDMSGLPWELKIMVYSLPETNYEYLVYIRIGMHHALTDGHGMVMITKALVESIHESLNANEPLDLNIPVANHSPRIETLHSVVDKRFLPRQWLYPILFVWRCFKGVLMLLAYAGSFFNPHQSYSGTLDPNHDLKKGKPLEEMTRLKLLEVSSALVSLLRKRANSCGGSIGSVLSISGLAAYKSVMEKYQKPSDYVSQSFVVNSRPLISDHSLIPVTHGSCTYPINIELHKMCDSDLFWDQVRVMKRKLNHRMAYLSPYIRVAALVPFWITKLLFSVVKPNKRRNQGLLLSNVGAFGGHQLEWAPNIRVENVVGSANSYWASNRAVFQITSLTANGKMVLAVVCPAYMVNETDFEYYCNSLLKILQKAAIRILQLERYGTLE